MIVELDEQIELFQRRFNLVKTEVSKVIVGYDDIIDGILMGLLARGHVLLEGVPGLGKTKLVQTLSGALQLRFSRIQFTPDLMPADITGTNVIQENELCPPPCPLPPKAGDALNASNSARAETMTTDTAIRDLLNNLVLI